MEGVIEGFQLALRLPIPVNGSQPVHGLHETLHRVHILLRLGDVTVGQGDALSFQAAQGQEFLQDPDPAPGMVEAVAMVTLLGVAADEQQAVGPLQEARPMTTGSI